MGGGCLRSDSFVEMQSIIVVSVNSQCKCLFFNLPNRSLNFACSERVHGRVRGDVLLFKRQLNN